MKIINGFSKFKNFKNFHEKITSLILDSPINRMCERDERCFTKRAKETKDSLFIQNE
jgi:hypothetical protein